MTNGFSGGHEVTDRVFALTVTLAKDTRTDDVQATVDAIRQLRGVMSVATHVTDVSQWAAEGRALERLRQRVWDALMAEATK